MQMEKASMACPVTKALGGLYKPLIALSEAIKDRDDLILGSVNADSDTTLLVHTMHIITQDVDVRRRISDLHAAITRMQKAVAARETLLKKRWNIEPDKMDVMQDVNIVD
jgi:hypothetical protein